MHWRRLHCMAPRRCAIVIHLIASHLISSHRPSVRLLRHDNRDAQLDLSCATRAHVCQSVSPHLMAARADVVAFSLPPRLPCGPPVESEDQNTGDDANCRRLTAAMTSRQRRRPAHAATLIRDSSIGPFVQVAHHEWQCVGVCFVLAVVRAAHRTRPAQSRARPPSALKRRWRCRCR